ncbi:MAG TPA: NUDIX pyrophosphatase [Ignavibacteria bacterium]|nr:NUDIX pyrophosphatase [Ignavibacteria bacterium]
MRATFQVLVIPYKIKKSIPYYAVFRRSDEGYWQFVAGGGEGDETIFEAAKRELMEEAGIVSGEIIQLDTVSSVPKSYFRSHAGRKDIYVIPEYCFAVKLKCEEIKLSAEHTEYIWEKYSTARDMLKYDGNRTALWELDEKIREGAV